MIGGLPGADAALGKSAWRAGARYLYAEVDASGVRNRDSSLLAESDFANRFGPPMLESVISSVQTTLSFDTRDNIFTPTKGLYSELNGGGGFRYLIARRHGLHAGVDFAYGEEGSAVYIQFGSAWFRP